MNVICMGGRTVGPFSRRGTFSKRFWPPNLARSLATCAAWPKVAALEPDAICEQRFEAKEKARNIRGIGIISVSARGKL